MPFLDLDDIRLHYTDQGHGPPVLLLAGMASDHASWAPLVNRLATHYRTIVPDLRCTGQTTPLTVSTSRSELVGDVQQLCRCLRLEQPVLVGHSMGAMLAWAVAGEAIPDCSALVLASAPPATQRARVELFSTLARLPGACESPDWFRLLYQFLFSPSFFDDPTTLDNAVSASLTYPWRQKNAALSRQLDALISFLDPAAPALPFAALVPNCPVLALTGENDILFTPAALKSVFGELDQVQTAIVAQAAHAVHWENPEDVYHLAHRFIDKALTR